MLFHILSILLCFAATRSTCRYLLKHRIMPKARYILFGFLRVRHLALAYLISMSIVFAHSVLFGIYLTFWS